MEKSTYIAPREEHDGSSRVHHAYSYSPRHYSMRMFAERETGSRVALQRNKVFARGSQSKRVQSWQIYIAGRPVSSVYCIRRIPLPPRSRKNEECRAAPIFELIVCREPPEHFSGDFEPFSFRRWRLILRGNVLYFNARRDVYFELTGCLG